MDNFNELEFRDQPHIGNAEWAERRGSHRHRTVYRLARVQRACDAGLWRVRNISNDGLMLAADVPIAKGEFLEIALSESCILRGKVVWAEAGRCGVAFAIPIDAPAVLRSLAAEQRAEGYRALRLPVACEAIFTQVDDAYPVDLINISHQGAGFCCLVALATGTKIQLLIPGCDIRREAIVRWSRLGRGGLWFTVPLERAELESMARLSPDGE